jgi:KaiC domain protein
VSSEDDWFERAIEDEDEDGKQRSDAGRDGKTEPPDERSETTAGEAVGEPDDDSERDDGWETAFSGDEADALSDDGDGTVDADLGSPGTPTETGTVASANDDDDDADDGGLFEDDFASALEGADVPGGAPGGGGPGGGGPGGPGTGAVEGGRTGDAGGFGTDESTDGADDFGLGSGFDGDDDFGGGGGFGMGGLDPGGGFDEEAAVDSDIDRIDLGIDGLDAMIQGGVPARSLMVAIGSAGTGKTTFGLQFLTRGLENGEPAVFIALEESRESIVESATEKGMPFDEYLERGDLAVVDIDPVEMANSLKNIRSELPGLVQDFGASRLVLDSVSLLEMMYQDRARRRNEIYDFTRSLKDAGVTTLLISEASDDNPYASRYGIVEYLTDAVFVLQYVRPSDFRETRLAVEIQKIRDANHSRETKPYDITDEGIDVYRQANIF